MPSDMNELSAGLGHVKDWAARHDAACTERNKAREKFESRTDTTISSVKQTIGSIDRRLTRLEVRIGIYSSAGAFGGAVLVQLGFKLLGW